jgi:hypothetical protein
MVVVTVMVVAPGVGAGGSGRDQKRYRQNGGDDAAHFKPFSNHARLR